MGAFGRETEAHMEEARRRRETLMKEQPPMGPETGTGSGHDREIPPGEQIAAK